MLFVRLLLLITVICLGAAYISQYVFGLEPCILCLYQRIPYFIVIILCILAMFARGKVAAILLILCGVTYIVGSAIAFYHVGVENGLFEMTSGCVDDLEVTSIEDMKAQLIGKPHVPCDKPQFTLFGISMAGFNFFLSSFVGWFTLILGIKMFKIAGMYKDTAKKLEDAERKNEKK